LRTMKRQVDDAMRALIAEGVEDGSIAPVDPKIAAFALSGSVNWPARWFREDGEMSAEQMAVQLVDFLTIGLAPR
jgi:hypothetical protein